MPTTDPQPQTQRDAAVNRANADNSILVLLIDGAYTGLTNYRRAWALLDQRDVDPALEAAYTKAITALSELREAQMTVWGQRLDAVDDKD